MTPEEAKLEIQRRIKTFRDKAEELRAAAAVIVHKPSTYDDLIDLARQYDYLAAQLEKPEVEDHVAVPQVGVAVQVK